MRTIEKVAVVFAFALVLCAPAVQAQFALLHEFAGDDGDGRSPYGSLTLSGTTLYGMTYAGGDSDLGTVFRINTDGSGFALLHEFAGGGSDGSRPNRSLTLSGATLYGMTYAGGDSDGGTVFQMNIDGSGFSLLHEFAGSDGSGPFGSLTLSGATLYGMTFGGGGSGGGTVFQMNTNGSGFSLLHEFAGSDGSGPFGSLTLSGATLYGMTSGGGDSYGGTVFRMKTDGSEFSLLREFAGGFSDGSRPNGSLTLSGATLYGLTSGGGDSDAGTVFQMNTDGNAFSLLREFAGGDSDGSRPYGSLTLSGATLYGVTDGGGDNNGGTVFQMNTNGSGFSLLHEFAVSNDGRGPYDSLTLSGATLYGMTYRGGDSDYGTVFSYAIPEPSTVSLLALCFGVLFLRRRRQG